MINRFHGVLGLLVLLAMGCGDARKITSAEGDMALVVEGNNRFATDLYGVAREEPGNLFFSPFSITAALSMVYGGAEGDTHTQMADVLGVELDEDAWHDNLAALFADLSGQHNRGYTLNTANAVWGQDGVPFVADYTALLDDTYGAPLDRVDFVANPTGARTLINDWIARQTLDHVPELFKTGDIDSLARLVVANAIYFEADWAARFDASETTDGTFHLSDGGSVQVPMMVQEADLGIASVDGIQILEMPYEDDELSMVVLLPADDDGLAALEQSLTPAQLDTWIDATVEQTVQVTFPAFELDVSLPLSSMLLELGMTDAFSHELADFTGMVAAGDMEDNYSITSTRHQATVQVDEKGTTAAAATGVVVGLRSVGGSLPFTADHPFVFLIRDRLTGAILFLGRVENPTANP